MHYRDVNITDSYEDRCDFCDCIIKSGVFRFHFYGGGGCCDGVGITYCAECFGKINDKLQEMTNDTEQKT